MLVNTCKCHHNNEVNQWTFLSNYAHVLVSINNNSELRVRDIADLVGITERATMRIISELEAAGVLSHTKEGRRNIYQVHHESPLRHTLESHRTVGELLEFLQQ